MRQEGLGEEAGAQAEAVEAARAAEARAVASAGLLRRENRSAMVLLDEKQLQVQRLEVGRSPFITLHPTPPHSRLLPALRARSGSQSSCKARLLAEAFELILSDDASLLKTMLLLHASLARRMSCSRQSRSCILWGTGWSGEGPSMSAVVTTEAHVAERPTRHRPAVPAGTKKLAGSGRGTELL